MKENEYSVVIPDNEKANPLRTISFLENYFNVKYQIIKNYYFITITPKNDFNWVQIIEGLSEENQKTIIENIAPKYGYKKWKQRKHSTGRTQKETPTPEKLSEEHKTMSVSKLAKKYGVSTTTIHRRLRKAK